MVDAITTGGGAAAGSAVGAVTRTAPAAPATSVATPVPNSAPSPVAETQLATLAKSVAAAAPVDTDRVARIKAALVNGTFPILPATIADQMMAFRYEWMSHDPRIDDNK